jgi:nucleoside-diphosphate-sugar epimerase/SAM-dependent methyltransferase
LLKQDVSKPFAIDGPVHFILHAASIASPIFYNKFRVETIDAGVLGTKNLLELAREKNTESFLFFSSSEVYGNPDPAHVPTKEEYNGNVSCTGPRACYDEPKRLGETLCMTYADVYNLPVKIVRPFNVFGPGMRLDDGRVMPNFVVSAMRGEKIPIYGDGFNTRTFCYISDAISAIYLVLLSDQNREVFNIGSDEQELSMKHLADIVIGLVQNDNARTHLVEGANDMYQKKADPQRRCPDLTKIRTTLGFKPEISLVSGIRRFITWVREEMERQSRGYGPQKACRICNNPVLLPVVSLGESPLANNLVTSGAGNKQAAEFFPLEMVYCPSCHLCQLSYVAPPEKMFKHYIYVTSTTETFKKHFSTYAETLTRDFALTSDSLVVDIGSNDGLLLSYFKEQGARVIGVEPAENIVEIARKKGIDTITGFFTESNANDILRIKGKADVVTANNVFAHINNIRDVVKNVRLLLKDSGVFCIEVQYLLDTLQKLTFDNIYHEHLSYYSLLALEEFFRRQEMQVFKVERVASHGGSLRVFVQKQGGPHPLSSTVAETIAIERAAGLDRYETYQKFAQEIYAIRNRFQTFVSSAKAQGKRVVGYGAPAKATTFLNFCGVDKNSIEYVVEDNALKHGLSIPGVNIPIVGPEALARDNPDYVALLAWNFAEEILRKNEAHRQRGIRFVIPHPEPKILQ